LARGLHEGFFARRLAGGEIMTSNMQQTVSLAGRVLLSAIFLLSGISKILHWSATADHMAAHGMPAVQMLLAGAVVVEVLGGLALLLGFQTRAASLILFLYLIPTTLIFHNFWAHQGAAQQDQMIHFLKNLAIMGGLLEVAAMGAGAWSLDAVQNRRRFAGFPGWWRGRRAV
jgi:putative oxidoreductase